MSAKQVAAKRANLTSIAAKVLGCVPIGDVWSNRQISAELYRQGTQVSPRIIDGCLRSLVDDGLIMEPTPMQFKQTAVHKPSSAPAEVMEFAQTTRKPEAVRMSVVAKTPAPPEAKPIDILAGLASRAATLAKQVSALAEDIENAAITITDSITAAERDSEKLRQLQSLLKGIG